MYFSMCSCFLLCKGKFFSSLWCGTCRVEGYVWPSPWHTPKYNILSNWSIVLGFSEMAVPGNAKRDFENVREAINPSSSLYLTLSVIRTLLCFVCTLYLQLKWNYLKVSVASWKQDVWIRGIITILRYLLFIIFFFL